MARRKKNDINRAIVSAQYEAIRRIEHTVRTQEQSRHYLKKAIPEPVQARRVISHSVVNRSKLKNILHGRYPVLGESIIKERVCKRAKNARRAMYFKAKGQGGAIRKSKRRTHKC